MITIHLHNVKFYCFHGVHEEERLLGNEYEINASIEFHEEEQIISIKETINYVDVFEMIKQRMMIPSHLLETIVMDIGNAIHNRYDYVRSIQISLTKVYPPITAIQGSVGVSWRRDY